MVANGVVNTFKRIFDRRAEETSLQYASNNTGQHAGQDGTVTLPQSTNINTGQYAGRNGTATPPQTDNSNTGQYAGLDVTVAQPQSDNDKGLSDCVDEDDEDSTEHEVEHEDQDNVMKAKLKELRKKIPKDFLIEKGNLHITGEIGIGEFGVVRKGDLVIPSLTKLPKMIHVAVKELKEFSDEKLQDDFIKEAINMQELTRIKNDNIVTLIGICLDMKLETFMIVTELAPLGDLRKYLQMKKEIIGVPKLLEFSLQIANGMLALENCNVLHRDLALRNILVAAEDKVKISDFGFSRFSEYYKAKVARKWPVKWYAPESLERNRFTTKSDVWSFGVTLWEMFTYGKEPYLELDHILIGERLLQPEKCPVGVYEIMQQCWKKDSIERPTFFFLHMSLIPNEMNKLLKKETTNCE